jgi:RNA methyltransferase, TrmH family
MTRRPAPSLPERTIKSRQNPLVQAAVRLRDRRERATRGLTLVDGTRELDRALAAGFSVEDAFVCLELAEGAAEEATLAALRRSAVVVRPVSRAVFDKLAFGDRAEAIVAVVRVPSQTLDNVVLPSAPLVAVVEGVEKPGNLGAILRSADGAGIAALIAADARTDLFNPNAVRASLGTIFSVPLAAASATETLVWLRGRGIRIMAARVDGSVLHTEADLTGPLAIAFGSEAEGLTAAWSAPDIQAVRLPMLGVADSLNVSVAAAVVFYEAHRQRGS